MKDDTVIAVKKDGTRLTFGAFLANPYQLRECISFSKEAIPIIRTARAFDPYVDASPDMLNEIYEEMGGLH